MATIRLTRHPLPSAAILIVLLVFAVVCSAGAEASCGDYLHSRRSVASTPQFSPHLAEANPAANVFATIDEPTESQGPIAPDPQPCSGPECRKAPLSIPLPVPVTVPGSHPDQILAILHRPACEKPAGTLQAGLCCPARAVPGFPLPIDVPPEVRC